jgi:predicted short-subunit dehydrogenase-like oxidoreductase (DUF2520 family)
MTPRSDTSHSLKVALVGAGRVGTAVALLLKQGGYPIAGVASRTTGSAKGAASRLECPIFDHRNELPHCDLVLLGVSEEAIEDTVALIAPRLEEGALVCHFAGSLGIAPLHAVREAGGRACATHPVQACPDVDSALKRLPGSFWGVTCDPSAKTSVEEIIRDLNGTPVLVGESDRPIWHAAAVTVSNGLAALMAVGESMLGAIGIEQPETVLGPLASGTIANARESGGGAATLTGPIVRSEDFVTDRHLRALTAKEPELVMEYSVVAQLIVRAAARAGRIDHAVADSMIDRLSSQ